MRDFLAPYEMRSDFAEFAVHRFEAGGFDIYRITNIFNQRALVAAEVVEVEIVALSDGGSIQKEPKEIVNPDEIVEDDYDDWYHEVIMTVKKVKSSGLRGKCVHSKRSVAL